MESLLKASQVLSQEVILSNLLEKMMSLVIENAGAEKGALIAYQERGLVVKLWGSADGKVSQTKETLLMESKDLPVSLINQVARTQQPITLENAIDQDVYKHDLYIRTYRPKSILCFPLVRKGKLSHIFYLENNLASGIFTEGRLQVLQMLSSPISIAIENALLYQNLESSLEQQVNLTNAYGKFVPHTFIQSLGHTSILDVQLGDQVHGEITILFADIRSYTSLSETMTPKENFNFLNAFIKRVTPGIKNNRGFVNQYFGDGLMALFLKHPEDAVKAAIEMQQAIKAYNEQRTQKGRQGIRIGIGIHTGSLILGIMGDEQHMQASVVSDAVNKASRLEGLTKSYDASIIISKDILEKIEDASNYFHRFLGWVQVKGKKERIAIHEIYNADPQKVIEIKQKANLYFQEGLQHYFKQDFITAAANFKKAVEIFPKDAVVQRYFQNAAKFMISGVPEDWAGTEIMDEK